MPVNLLSGFAFIRCCFDPLIGPWAKPFSQIFFIFPEILAKKNRATGV
ncbi:hypothetical protein DVDV_1444 [Desulfovibrio sp. DV]|nr:hypothetical protein DVDV_1444 [Desulfovibrio sp. DV]